MSRRRGAKPGERRGGRQKGTPNKAAVHPEIRELCRQWTAEAVETLVSVMRQTDNLPAAISAAREILDRGWGKPVQPVSGADAEGPVRVEVVWLSQPELDA